MFNFYFIIIHLIHGSLTWSVLKIKERQNEGSKTIDVHSISTLTGNLVEVPNCLRYIVSMTLWNYLTKVPHKKNGKYLLRLNIIQVKTIIQLFWVTTIIKHFLKQHTFIITKNKNFLIEISKIKKNSNVSCFNDLILSTECLLSPQIPSAHCLHLFLLHFCGFMLIV